MLNYRWAQQAVQDADVLVLGVGQHFTSLIYGAPKPREQQPLVYSFFANELNRTLSALVSMRTAYGRFDPSAIAIVGPTLPVPGCQRVAAPQTLAEAVMSEVKEVTTHEYGPSYWHNVRLNEMARWLADRHGVSFLDIATTSFMRADDSLARGRNDAPSKTAGYANADCMHYCLPGVVDTFSQLLYNLLEPRAAASTTVATPAPRANANASREVQTRVHRRLRFFKLDGWLTERGASKVLEQCSGMCVDKAGELTHTRWWLYDANCSIEQKSLRKRMERLHSIRWDPEEVFAFYGNRTRALHQTARYRQH
jgi:hypothetical protein